MNGMMFHKHRKLETCLQFHLSDTFA